MTEKILEKALDGERISPEEAVLLFETTDMLLLGNIASRISRKKLRERVVTYIVDRNINYTNICITDCAFCAFCVLTLKGMTPIFLQKVATLLEKRVVFCLGKNMNLALK